MTYWWNLLVASWWDWEFDKWWLSAVLNVSDDALHISAGLAILSVAAWVMRRPPWSWRPWLAVLAIELCNEAYDLSRPAGTSSEATVPKSLHDVCLTLLWPTIAVLLLPRLVRRYAPPPADPA